MLRYTHLAIILIAVYMPDQTWAIPTLAGIQLALTAFFYYMVFGLLSGLSRSGLNEDIDIQDMLITRIVTGLSLTILIMTGQPIYWVIAALAMPWYVTNILTDIFAILVKYEVLEITDKE